MRMKQFVAVILAFFLAEFSARNALAATPSPLGQAVKFDNAGLSLVFPKKQQPSPSFVSPKCIVRYVELRGGKLISRTTLYAFVFSESSSITPKKMLDMLTAERDRDVNTIKSETASEKDVKVSGQSGRQLVTQLKLKQHASDIVAVSTVWSRPKNVGKKKVYYCILYEQLGKDVELAEDISDRICDSAKIIPLQSPSEMDLPPLGERIILPRNGFSVCIPVGWRELGGRPSVVVFRAGIADLKNSAVALPNMNVTVVTRGEKPGAKDLPTIDDKYLAARTKELESMYKNMNWKGVASSVAVMSGCPAAQIVSTIEPEPGKVMTQVVRQIFTETHVYTLTLTWGGNNVKRAVAAMDVLAKGFLLIRPGEYKKKQVVRATSSDDPGGDDCHKNTLSPLIAVGG